MAQHWTLREDENGAQNQQLLGEGGYGEVHRASNYLYLRVALR